MRFHPVSWILLAAAAIATASVTAGLAQPPGDPADASDRERPPSADAAPDDDSPEESAEQEDRLESPQLDGPGRRAELTDDEAAAREKIERALRGEPVEVTGDDPVLDDVLKIIRGRGSILDGTVLDGTELDPDGDTAADQAAAAVDNGRGESQPQAAVGRHEARAAEMLLRTARLLQRLQPVDQRRRELIVAMRAEAARVLSP